MAKRIVNPYSLIMTQVGGEIRTRFDYGLECDDGLAMRQSISGEGESNDLPWTADELDSMHDLLDKGTDHAETKEEI